MSTNINELISVLNENKSLFDSDMGSIINKIKFNIKNWQKYIKYNKATYNRNIIYSNENFEVIIITWLPRQHTPVHFHPNNGCILKLLYGSLNEIRITDKTYSDKKINENDIGYMSNDYGSHIISNNSNKPAISLHIYSPPGYYNK